MKEVSHVLLVFVTTAFTVQVGALAAAPDEGPVDEQGLDELGYEYSGSSLSPVDYPPEKPGPLTLGENAFSELEALGWSITVESGEWVWNLEPSWDVDEVAAIGVSHQSGRVDVWKSTNEMRAKALATPTNFSAEVLTWTKNAHVLPGDTLPFTEYSGFKYVTPTTLGTGILDWIPFLPTNHTVKGANPLEVQAHLKGYFEEVSEETTTHKVHVESTCEYDPTFVEVGTDDYFKVVLFGSAEANSSAHSVVSVHQRVTIESAGADDPATTDYLIAAAGVVAKASWGKVMKAQSLSDVVAMLWQSADLDVGVDVAYRPGDHAVDAGALDTPRLFVMSKTKADSEVAADVGDVSVLGLGATRLNGWLDGRVRCIIYLGAYGPPTDAPPTTGDGIPTTDDGTPTTDDGESTDDGEVDRPRGPVTPRPDGGHSREPDPEADPQ